MQGELADSSAGGIGASLLLNVLSQSFLEMVSGDVVMFVKREILSAYNNNYYQGSRQTSNAAQNSRGGQLGKWFDCGARTLRS